MSPRCDVKSDESSNLGGEDVEVLEVGEMTCGTKIQLEDWHNDFDFLPKASTLAAYPVSKIDVDGQFAPKKGRKLRVSFNFESEMEARQAFRELARGVKQLLDFSEFINDPRKIECL